MIIGNGLLGNVFRLNDANYYDYIIFASGVSDSKNTDTNSSKREEDLILKTLSENKGLTFIYFSSILANVVNNDYYKHKLRMEELIKDKAEKYLIFRIPQIVGSSGNQNNLFNHLVNNVKTNKTNIIYDNVERAIVDVDDLKLIVDYCKDKILNEIINLSHIEKLSIIDLSNKIYSKFNITPNISITTNIQNENWTVDNSNIIKEALNKLKIITSNYTDKIIIKYT
jgi:UDP-2-acetamido-2,6-beta-L-arabino-hexul-4-ose reductase